jgi:hypothetical protein
MRAKLLKESLSDLLKPKDESSKEYLDSLSLLEIIKMVENVTLVTREGYGGQNKLGHIPNYVLTRLNKEGTILENSYNTYQTWDNYTLIQIPELEPPQCIMLINSSGQGTTYIIKIVKFKVKIIKKYEVDWS